MIPSPVGPKLRSLGGEVPPATILRDAEQALELPPRIRQRFWDILGPCLAEPLPGSLESDLDRLCAEHALAPDALARALKACRFLVRNAAAHDLDARAFAEDLALLSGGSTQLADLLVPGYESARAVVRSELARAAIHDHGKVLEGVDWRIDVVTASSQAAKLRAPIAVITLHYREGSERERLTLQATPESLESLRDLCDRMLGPKAGS
ncbi:MAG: COMM domain-containing protein [Byssovorax sp.]